jgi:hypothetical protein
MDRTDRIQKRVKGRKRERGKGETVTATLPFPLPLFCLLSIPVNFFLSLLVSIV